VTPKDYGHILLESNDIRTNEVTASYRCTKCGFLFVYYYDTFPVDILAGTWIMVGEGDYNGQTCDEMIVKSVIV